ncbi:MAG: hypothetical protein K2Q26_03290 [Bdellovibrionales bacterium]|nr:hypothetical protein [Bdellovibrionales bacterium]
MRLLLVLWFMVGSTQAFAQFKCWDKIEAEKQNLAEVEEKEKNGEATKIDVLSAKLAVNQQSSDCGLVAKYNYCYYQSTLMQSMLNIFKQQPSFETPFLNADSVEEDMKSLKEFCLNASASHPQDPDDTIGQPSEDAGE